jgi:hypothetical protein
VLSFCLCIGSEVYPEVNVQKEKFVVKLKFPENDEISDLEVGLSSVSKVLLYLVNSPIQTVEADNLSNKSSV